MNTSNIHTLKFVDYDTETLHYAASCQLRNTVLRRPLGLDLFAEDLSQECHHRHFGALFEERLIGCLVIVPRSDTVVTLRQMCVDEDFQGQRIGQRLVQYVEKVLRDHKVDLIELSARVPAIPFYEKLGYTSFGDEFLSVGITHQKMAKKLS